MQHNTFTVTSSLATPILVRGRSIVYVCVLGACVDNHNRHDEESTVKHVAWPNFGYKTYTIARAIARVSESRNTPAVDTSLLVF